GIEPNETMEPMIAESIRAQLLRLNSEFANYTPAERQLPRITLCSFADPEYFPSGVKHRYTRK
ncbi:MAG: phenylacetate--CoA ligase family protein, partial [Methylococcaceae bacterium]|nr:phenylacetate--CoA ligase family protein [Methylococcaceae bacterium]